MRQITTLQIQFVLPMKLERPTNLTFDMINYEFSQPLCLRFNIDFESDEKWAIEPASDFVTH